MEYNSIYQKLRKSVCEHSRNPEGSSFLDNGIKQINKDFYYKREIIGTGATSIVFYGYQASADRMVAVKFINEEITRRYKDGEREMMVMHDLAKLNHPNIMGYYGYEVKEGIIEGAGTYFFLEYCGGGTLKKKIQQGMPELKVLDLFSQILDAMTYIHQESTR
jgi:serine/threonine protein kinase